MSQVDEEAREIIENANIPVAVLSIRGIILEANRRWHDMLGLAPQQLVGHHIWAVAPLVMKWASLSSGERVAQVIPLRRPNRKHVHVQFSSKVVELKSGPIIFLLGRDVTEHLRMKAPAVR
jgi:PAS domain S-box-containing protein